MLAKAKRRKAGWLSLAPVLWKLHSPQQSTHVCSMLSTMLTWGSLGYRGGLSRGSGL